MVSISFAFHGVQRIHELDMDFLFLVAITLKISGTLQKKTSGSEESIENILYYKDCNKPPATAAPIVQVPFRQVELPPPKPPECVPRMCCSMSCSNTCGQDQEMVQPMSSGMQPGHQMHGRQSSSPNEMPMGSMMQPMMQGMQQNNHQSQQSIIPFNQRARKKKMPLKKPIMTRRNLGFTRDHIKSLISHDEDIKKILKDLVRVTMQKVDLVDQINSRRSSNHMAQVNRNVRNYYASAVNKKEEEDETNRLMEEED